jgi:hypothetical protein
MKKLLRSDTRSVFVDCDSQKAFKFVSSLDNLPKWEPSVCTKVTKEGGQYLCDTPAGEHGIRAEANSSLGVIDRYLSLTRDEELMLPMRIIPNGSGCEVLSTIFHHSDISNDEYTRRVRLMEEELSSLKNILERNL